MSSRQLHASISYSGTLAQLDDWPWRLFFSMLAQSDSWGRLEGDVDKIRIRCVPRLKQKRSDAEIEAALTELVRVRRVRLYTVDDTGESVLWAFGDQGARYAYLEDFEVHQTRLGTRRGKSLFPVPPMVGLPVASTTRQRRADDASSPRACERAAMDSGFAFSSSDVDLDSKTAAASPAAKRGTRRDPLWEALLTHCGIDATTLTESGSGAANRAVQQLREVGADADEIRRRATEYQRRFTVPLTPAALAKHWAMLGPQSEDDDDLAAYVRA